METYKNNIAKNNKVNKKYFESNFKITKKFLNIDTNAISLEFKIDIGNGIKINQTFLRDEIYGQANRFLNSGIDISDKNGFIKKLAFEEKNAPLFLHHSSLGFAYINNKLVYKADVGVNIDSSYIGTFDVFPHGTYEGWIATVKENVIGTTPLEFMLIAGLSSVTIGFLGDRIDGSMLIHVYSDSSKGKTTGCYLALSTAGNPLSTSNCRGLQIDWGDTFNYRIATLSGNHGIPIVIDEASKISEKDVTSFIYSCCNGISKGRVSSDGSLKDIYTWKTCCISNGEQSLLPLCNNNQGIRARLIEIPLNTITNSAEQADNLKEGIFENYGFANKILAEYILNNQEIVIELFEKWTSKFSESLKELGPLMSRIAKRLAVLMTTTIISSNALQLNFDINEIQKLLIKSIVVQSRESSLLLIDRLINHITEDFLSHAERYSNKLSNDKDISIPANCYAIFNDVSNKKGKYKDSSYEVLFFTNKFEKLLKEGGFNNKLLCLKELSKAGILHHDKDRYTCKRKIMGQQMMVYSLLFNGETISKPVYKVI